MMGRAVVSQAVLFYEFDLERHVPASHLIRAIDRFLDLSTIPLARWQERLPISMLESSSCLGETNVAPSFDAVS
jgi:hypothetical protein